MIFISLFIILYLYLIFKGEIFKRFWRPHTYITDLCWRDMYYRRPPYKNDPQYMHDLYNYIEPRLSGDVSLMGFGIYSIYIPIEGIIIEAEFLTRSGKNIVIRKMIEKYFIKLISNDQPIDFMENIIYDIFQKKNKFITNENYFVMVPQKPRTYGRRNIVHTVID